MYSTEFEEVSFQILILLSPPPVANLVDSADLVGDELMQDQAALVGNQLNRLADCRCANEP